MSQRMVGLSSPALLTCCAGLVGAAAALQGFVQLPEKQKACLRTACRWCWLAVNSNR